MCIDEVENDQSNSSCRSAAHKGIAEFGGIGGQGKGVRIAGDFPERRNLLLLALSFDREAPSCSIDECALQTCRGRREWELEPLYDGEPGPRVVPRPGG